ncbi:hypothetical protein [Bdellovibrio bacteriovorus]|uniref:hypothetical protein n=1 Tax=Bdellovibrio bacteriovorus TaxID=959 RepID=UPI001F48BBFB|nr:hypothetical protein [Bdellovibrio bacteriovorus]
MKNWARLQRLARHRGLPGFLMVVVFAACALISLGLAGFFGMMAYSHQLPMWSSVGSALAMLLLAGTFVFGSRVFLRERQMDVLRKFLRHPDSGSFVVGKLTSFNYVAGDSRKLSRYFVEGEAEGPQGQTLFVGEFFDADIWPFTTEEGDRQIQKDDDWYDLKGKRRTLPIPAYFICETNDPKIGVLVGIDQALLNDALKRSEMKTV